MWRRSGSSGVEGALLELLLRIAKLLNTNWGAGGISSSLWSIEVSVGLLLTQINHSHKA